MSMCREIGYAVDGNGATATPRGERVGSVGLGSSGCLLLPLLTAETDAFGSSSR